MSKAGLVWLLLVINQSLLKRTAHMSSPITKVEPGLITISTVFPRQYKMQYRKFWTNPTRHCYLWANCRPQDQALREIVAAVRGAAVESTLPRNFRCFPTLPLVKPFPAKKKTGKGIRLLNSELPHRCRAGQYPSRADKVERPS